MATIFQQSSSPGLAPATVRQPPINAPAHPPAPASHQKPRFSLAAMWAILLLASGKAWGAPPAQYPITPAAISAHPLAQR